MFWLLWFLLARANPEGEALVAENSVEAKYYDAFCSTILNHTVGAANDTRHVLACRSIDQYRQTLHPKAMMRPMATKGLMHWPKQWQGRTRQMLGLRTEGGFTGSIATGRNCSA